MKKFILTAVSILFTLTAATYLFAMDHNWERGPGMGGAMGRQAKAGGYALYARLNLDGEQKAKLEALRLAHLKDIKPLRDQLFSKGGDLRLLWLQPVPDKANILAAQKELRNIRDQIADKATAHRVDAFNILTPEQKEKARAFAAAHRFGRQGAGRGWMGHGAGGGNRHPGAMMHPCPSCGSDNNQK